MSECHKIVKKYFHNPDRIFKETYQKLTKRLVRYLLGYPLVKLCKSFIGHIIDFPKYDDYKISCIFIKSKSFFKFIFAIRKIKLTNF